MYQAPRHETIDAAAGTSAAGTPGAAFWEASSLADVTANGFAARVAAAPPPSGGVHRFVGPAPVRRLPPVRDRLQRLLARRRSERHFEQRSLTTRQVSRLLAAVGAGPGGRRLVPTAGGYESLVTYAIGVRVDGPLGGRIVRYDAVVHGVADVGAAPGEATVRRLFMLDPDAALPALILVFAVDEAATVAKYGDRGTRFVIQHVGHAAQNVGLRLAADGLRGYVLGGGLDAEVLALLGLGGVDARYGGAIACGR